jgi:hypothetical protein
VPDKETLDLVRATTTGAVAGIAEPYRDGFAAVFGDAARQVSATFEALAWLQRLRVAAKVVEKAEKILVRLGIDPAPVRLKLLAPLLESASLEDEGDETMQDLWAALLANAAAGDRGAEVLPSFVTILAELTPPQATLLDAIYTDPPATRPQTSRTRWVRESVDASDGEFALWLGNLARLDLCAISGPPPIGLSPGSTDWENAYLTHGLQRTEWGNAFVSACRAPSAA